MIVSGGIPLRRGGAITGAIGVSGGGGDQVVATVGAPRCSTEHLPPMDSCVQADQQILRAFTRICSSFSPRQPTTGWNADHSNGQLASHELW
jgi:hypothetical protein